MFKGSQIFDPVPRVVQGVSFHPASPGINTHHQRVIKRMWGMDLMTVNAEMKSACTYDKTKRTAQTMICVNNGRGLGA